MISPSPVQKNDQCVTRFAPSPTGHMHLGHVYAAKFARDIASKHSGTYLLRFEDIDITRVREEYYTSILEDLAWLGIEHSGTPMKQIDRSDAYNKAVEKLKQTGVLYPCFCTRKQIQRELKSLNNAPHSTADTAALYPNTCRSLTQQEIDTHIRNGKTPSWRINTDLAYQLTGDLTFHDLEHGTINVNHHLLGDAVLARRDIGTSYHIAVIVDDAHQQVTHVTRGEDLLETTHLHRVLLELLELPVPIYHHHRIITDTHGQRLAKRAYSETIKDLRKLGKTTQEILAMIAD